MRRLANRPCLGRLGVQLIRPANGLVTLLSGTQTREAFRKGERRPTARRKWWTIGRGTCQRQEAMGIFTDAGPSSLTSCPGKYDGLKTKRKKRICWFAVCIIQDTRYLSWNVTNAQTTNMWVETGTQQNTEHWTSNGNSPGKWTCEVKCIISKNKKKQHIVWKRHTNSQRQLTIKERLCKLLRHSGKMKLWPVLNNVF